MIFPIVTVNVTYADKQVFTLETDISLASNPVISFALRPDALKGDLKVGVKDSKGETWSHAFLVPGLSN